MRPLELPRRADGQFHRDMGRQDHAAHRVTQFRNFLRLGHLDGHAERLPVRDVCALPGASDEATRDPRWTALIQFDGDWRQREAWVYPEEVVSRLGVMSISGGVFAPDGRLYCTGHDNAEIYVLRFPEGGSVLVLDEIVPTMIHGQGIALDPNATGLLYGIDRPKKEIIVARLTAL